jgi:hypothetical protein
MKSLTVRIYSLHIGPSGQNKRPRNFRFGLFKRACLGRKYIILFLIFFRGMALIISFSFSKNEIYHKKQINVVH